MTVNQSLISHCLLSKTAREEMLGARVSVSSCSVPRVLRLYSPCILPFRTVVRQTCSAVLSSSDMIRQPNFFPVMKLIHSMALAHMMTNTGILN